MDVFPSKNVELKNKMFLKVMFLRHFQIIRR